MPMRPFTEDYDEYLQSSKDEFADLENRSFEEQQLIRSAAERDPRQYRGIGYGGLTGEEKEAIAAAGMELPKDLIARENVQQKYRRAAQVKGFGFDEKTAPGIIAEKTIEAEKAGLRDTVVGGDRGSEGIGLALQGMTMSIEEAKAFAKKLATYVVPLGLGAFAGIPAPAQMVALAKRFGVKFGVEALKSLYSQTIGGGGTEEGYEPGYGVPGTPESQSTMGTPSIGMEGIPTQEEQAEAGTAFGPIGPSGFGMGEFGGRGGEGVGGGDMGGGRGGDTEGESDPSGGMGGY